MLFKRTAFVVLSVLLLTAPSFADEDTASTFIMGVGSVLAAQDQEVEDVTSLFQLDVIRLLPQWVPWYIGGMAEYSQVRQAGQDEIDVNGRLIIFFSDPNGSERGEWVGFMTVGGVEIYDNDGSEDSRIVRTSTDGSIGVIAPLAGMNVVVQLGVQRMPGVSGKTETFWKFGVGFFGLPKSPIKF